MKDGSSSGSSREGRAGQPAAEAQSSPQWYGLAGAGPADAPTDGHVEDDDDPATGVSAEIEIRERRVDGEAHGERLDRVLVALAPEFSRSHLQSLVEAGCVTVDGAVVTQSSRKVRAGQHLLVRLVPTAESRAFRAEDLPLSVVYEDADLLVVDKAAGMVVHPAAGNWSGTLLNALLARDPASASLPRAGIVHRLDTDTSGLMLVARTLPAMTALVRAIAARTVSRRYLAIAAITRGAPRAASFSVEQPIGRDPRVRTRMAVVASAKPARTDVERLADDGRHAALRCTLHTGRTHQIRVHLASVGLPLVGDALYGGTPALGMTRQALHAAELSLAHPITGAPLMFRAVLPADMAAAWAEVTMEPNDRPSSGGRVR